MPGDAEIVRNATPLVSKIAVQQADGADLALRFYEAIHIEGMPDGTGNRVRILVASIPALLAMKGYAMSNRLKRKDAYDIYYCVRNSLGGLAALVVATSALLEVETARNGYLGISEKFRHVGDFGPTSVRRFVETFELLGERTCRSMAAGRFRSGRRLADSTGLEVNKVSPAVEVSERFPL